MIFKPWKTIRLQTYSPERIEAALSSSRVRVSDSALDVLVTVAPWFQPRDIRLAKVLVSALDLTETATSHAILERAMALGLHLVPAAVGPFLRCDYNSQPDGERLLLGMEPVFCSGYPYIFALTAAERVLELQTEWGNLGHVWGDPSSYWIFEHVT